MDRGRDSGAAGQVDPARADPRDRAQAARLRLRELYARVGEEIAASPSLFCLRSGCCCRFREAGHELYLTRLEYDEMAARGGPPAGGGADACPWLRNGLCGNREGRALACRTYFCSDEAAAAELTERWHRGVRQIHDALGLAYSYAPLTRHVNF
ncbi:MAG: hypothetical protein ACREID_01830 [Planctomycetota bacterium]